MTLPGEAQLIYTDLHGQHETIIPDVELDAVRTAIELAGRGIRRGDRVLLIADNSVEFIAVLFGLIHLDVSIVLADSGQVPRQHRQLVLLTGADWVITDADLGRVAEFSDIAKVLLSTDLRADPGRPGRGQRLSFDAWRGRDDALITSSSGTTGAAKVIVRSGSAIWENADRTREQLGYRASDVLLPLLPFSHQYGLSLLLVWWLTGCSLVVAPRVRVDHALEAAALAGVTAVDATPSTYHTVLGILEQRPVLRDRLGSVRMWCVGGAPLGQPLAKRFHAVVGASLLDGYGSTEAGNIALATPDDPHGCGHPLPGVELQIRDDGGKPVADGEIGEIRVRSAGLFEGYLAEDGTLDRRDGDWYLTHDLGFRDGQGRLHVIGRKHAVHRLGYTLYPAELARKAEACGRPITVVPLDDDRRGCRLVFVVADPHLGNGQHWRRRMSEHLADFEQPNQVVVVGAFPVTRNGKPDQARLKQIAAASMPTVEPRPARVETSESPARPGRAARLAAVRSAIEADPGPVLDILTEISNFRSAESEIWSALDTLRGAVAEVEKYRPGRVPRMAVFMPSNIVFYSYVLQLLVPSLFVDEVGFRSSQQVAGTMRRLHELLAPIHGLPITLHPLTQREFLDGPVAHADLVTFTGAYKNAEQVRTAVRKDQLFLYYGQGVNPFIVGPDADLDKAVTDAIRIRLFNSGQDCFGPDVFFVHHGCFDRFVGLLAERVRDLRFGQYTDPSADYGPLYYESALTDAVDHLREHGEHIVSGGQVDFRTGHLQPTVLARPMSTKVPVAELFSPIFNVMRYDSTVQLRERVTSEFFRERAMGAMVYGDDTGISDVLADRHLVCHDTTLLDVDNGNEPFGGRGMIANYLAHRGKRTARPLLISESVAEHLTPDRTSA